ncbi:MAG: hypothetical protein ACWGON_04075, partial [Gemmatimonadota bacterium]
MPGDFRTPGARIPQGVGNRRSDIGEPETEQQAYEAGTQQLVAIEPDGRRESRAFLACAVEGFLQFEQLGGRSIQTETIYLHTVLRNSKRWQALLEAVEAADLVTLAFPLYCDSLPTPVTE